MDPKSRIVLPEGCFFGGLLVMDFILSMAHPQLLLPPKHLCSSGTIGHHSLAILKKVLNTNKIVCNDRQSSSFFCPDCALGKNHKPPFTSNTSTVSTSLALIHCDIWSPAPISFVSGYRFYVLFLIFQTHLPT